MVECTAPAIGIETGGILNSQMTASTGNASLARLNGRFAWCPLIDGYGEYIQVKKDGNTTFFLEKLRRVYSPTDDVILNRAISLVIYISFLSCCNQIRVGWITDPI